MQRKFFPAAGNRMLRGARRDGGGGIDPRDARMMRTGIVAEITTQPSQQRMRTISSHIQAP